GTRGEQIANLSIHRVRIVHRRFVAAASIEIDLCLLCHGERTGNRHLHLPTAMFAEETQIRDAHRLAPPARTDHARNWVSVAAAIEGRAGIVQIDSIEGRRKAVRIALTTDLAIGDNVEPGVLLSLDGNDGCIILGLLQPGVRYAPQLT